MAVDDLVAALPDIAASFRRVRKTLLPPQIMVGMPIWRASSAKGPSRKHTSWAVMV